MNPNSNTLSSLPAISLRASSPVGNASAAPPSAASDTPVALGSSEFSRMLANNQANARQFNARQNNAVAEGKFTEQPKTPDAPVRPSAEQKSANAGEQANASQAVNDAAESHSTRTPVCSERDTGKPADADAAVSDEPRSAEVSGTPDAVSPSAQQSATSDPAALAVPVAVLVPTTVPLAQAPQLLAGKAEVTDDASAASASLLSMTATTHAERGTAALHRSTPRATPAQQLPAAGKLNAATLAQASHGAQPAAAAAAALTDKSAESARSSQFVTAVDRAGPDVSAFSGVQAMLGDSLNPAPQMRTQPKVDVAADTLLSPSDTAQVAIRQDFSALMPTGLSLAAASAPAAREAATEASLAVLGRGSLSEPRSSALAGLDAAQSGVFALPTAGAGVAVRGSEIPVPVQANVPTPFAEPGFQQALGYEVSLLARDGIGEAELHLNPADMGPVSVQITMTGDQARVDFGADLAQTRQALEAGWAELASSLKDAGFTLSGGGVSDHARGRQAQRSPAAPLSFGGRASLDSGVTSVMAPAVARRFNGTVDTYA